MKQADAQQAIDEAFTEGLKDLFVVLERNLLQQGDAVAATEFEKGVAKFDQAHAIASSAIEKIFPE